MKTVIITLAFCLSFAFGQVTQIPAAGGGGAGSDTTAAHTNSANTYTGGGTQDFGTSTLVIGATVIDPVTGLVTPVGTFGTAGSSGKVTLSGGTSGACNLTVTATATAITGSTAAECDAGTTTLPLFKNIYFAGTSGTPGTNLFKFTGASTGGLRTVTFPDASGTVAYLASPAFTGTPTMPLLGVGALNTSLGTTTASFLNRTATTGATLVSIGTDENGHSSALTTQLHMLMGATQGTTKAISVERTAGDVRFYVDQDGTLLSNGLIDYAFTYRLSNNPSGLIIGGSSAIYSTAVDISSTRDTSLSRISAGVWGAGTGAVGSTAGTFRGAYQSSDGTAGATVTNCTGFKNGLCVSGT